MGKNWRWRVMETEASTSKRLFRALLSAAGRHERVSLSLIVKLVSLVPWTCARAYTRVGMGSVCAFACVWEWGARGGWKSERVRCCGNGGGEGAGVPRTACIR
eukprot:6213209-Pleurochrysis_carterae.AAC.1